MRNYVLLTLEGQQLFGSRGAMSGSAQRVE